MTQGGHRRVGRWCCSPAGFADRRPGRAWRRSRVARPRALLGSAQRGAATCSFAAAAATTQQPPAVEEDAGRSRPKPRPSSARSRARQQVGQVAEPEAIAKLDTARTVMVVGDFMAGGLAEGLDSAYAQNPDIKIIDRSNGSSGFVRADFHDWPADDQDADRSREAGGGRHHDRRQRPPADEDRRRQASRRSATTGPRNTRRAPMRSPRRSRSAACPSCGSACRRSSRPRFRPT